MDSKAIYKVGIFAFLIVNLILTFTDQTGFFDYVVLVLTIISIAAFIGYLILKRKEKPSEE